MQNAGGKNPGFAGDYSKEHRLRLLELQMPNDIAPPPNLVHAQSDPHEAPEIGDRTLLERFIASRDETAFAGILERHGRTVLGVCRRVLGHAEDAEDAFQATFLVLARQANCISRRESLGTWLYGVAYRVSLRARKTMSRRQTHEAARAAQVSFDQAPPREEQEFQLIVDEELHRLPARFRAPLVLCYFEGKTNEETARELGVPPGTVFSRLARGRERLRKLLARRGVILTAGAIASLLLAQGASAAVPATLAAATAASASAFALGTPAAVGTIASGVLGLTHATLRTLHVLHLKHLATVALLATIGAAGAGLFGWMVYDANFSPRSVAAASDSRELQGVWTVVSQEQGGNELASDKLQAANSRLIFEGNLLRSRDTAPNGDDVGQDVTYRLDPTQSPKAIDLKRYGRTVLGIYELDGDTLKLCVDREPGRRPTQFKTTPGRNEILHVARRAGAAK